VYDCTIFILYYILTEPILTQNEHLTDTALDFCRN